MQCVQARWLQSLILQHKKWQNALFPFHAGTHFTHFGAVLALSFSQLSCVMGHLSKTLYISFHKVAVQHICLGESLWTETVSSYMCFCACGLIKHTAVLPWRVSAPVIYQKLCSNVKLCSSVSDSAHSVGLTLEENKGLQTTAVKLWCQRKLVVESHTLWRIKTPSDIRFFSDLELFTDRRGAQRLLFNLWD